jgi:hypothetical protein
MSDVTVAYKKNNYKVIFGKRLNKNFAVEGSYTNYSSDEVGMSSMSAANAAKTDNAITFNCVFILLPYYYYYYL